MLIDYNLSFNDPHFSSGTLDQVQVGGKIGIIRDPFGPDAEYLGATTPIEGASVDHLALSSDGSTLYASLDSWDGATQSSGLLEFNVANLIGAALSSHSLTTPIDLNNSAVQPVKLDLGWIYGIGAPALACTIHERGEIAEDSRP